MQQVPQDFADALKTTGLAAFFADCTGAHKREYLRWVTEAKHPEARSARIKQAMKMLAAKQGDEAKSARKTR